MASRSGPVTGTAVARRVCVPSSTVTWGLASRFRYQSGLSGAPPLEAKTNVRPSWARYITGFTHSVPVLRPVVCSSSTGAPSNGPPTRPSLARNSSTTLRFQSLATVMALLRPGPPCGGPWRLEHRAGGGHSGAQRPGLLAARRGQEVLAGSPGQRVVVAEHPLTVRQGALVERQRGGPLAGRLVGGSQVAPGGQGVWVVGPLHPFPVGHDALIERQRVAELVCPVVGIGQVAAGGQGVRVVGPLDPFPVGQHALVAGQ